MPNNESPAGGERKLDSPAGGERELNSPAGGEPAGGERDFELHSKTPPEPEKDAEEKDEDVEAHMPLGGRPAGGSPAGP